MKKDSVKLGVAYAARVSGNVVPVRLEKVNPHGGWDGVNLTTKKPVRIKSSQRLRGLWPKKTMPITPEAAQAIHHADQEDARLNDERSNAPDGQTASERAMAAPAPKAKKGRKTDDKGVAETVAAVEKGNLAEGLTVPESTRGDNSNDQKTDGQVTTPSGPKAKRGRKAAKDTVGESGCDTGERGATGAKHERNSLLNLAAIALAEAGQPLNCREMVERVLATGLWKSDGKTPAQTLASAILREMKTKGDASRFRKVGPGKFEAIVR
jgi:hypothetical protein